MFIYAVCGKKTTQLDVQPLKQSKSMVNIGIEEKQLFFKHLIADCLSSVYRLTNFTTVQYVQAILICNCIMYVIWHRAKLFKGHLKKT